MEPLYTQRRSRSPSFLSYLSQHYQEVKEQYAGEGRRRWRLRVARQFWQQIGRVSSTPTFMAPEAVVNADFVIDDDPLDDISSRRPELGLIVRTDFSDEDAWASFYDRLQQGEKEYIEESDIEDQVKEGSRLEHIEQAMHSASTEGPGDENESDDSDDEIATPIFYVINPSTLEERAPLTNISNLTALRLLNDVDVQLAPSPEHVGSRCPSGRCQYPSGSQLTTVHQQTRPPNRLVDFNGWQEIYLGKNIWIYDSKSNIDQCVRVVSQSGDMYGTAT
ncbi:hypothetical protein ID866_526 [Astraeus odoratus]|nr:hypothetical protein ID866_526 [Astraeus odoratus]